MPVDQSTEKDPTEFTRAKQDESKRYLPLAEVWGNTGWILEQ
jgi:hypothetical protein